MKSMLVGREIEQSQIIQIVTKDDKRCRIISIWGMGGLGKTALARSIYEHPNVDGRFNMKAWISLSCPFNFEDVVRSLVVKLEKADLTRQGTLKTMELEDLVEQLNMILHKGHYLIVLQNVSSIDVWKVLKELFHEEHFKSQIIVTTRVKSVAEHCSQENTYKLEALNDDAALELFREKVNT